MHESANIYISHGERPVHGGIVLIQDPQEIAPKDLYCFFDAVGLPSRTDSEKGKRSALYSHLHHKDTLTAIAIADNRWRGDTVLGAITGFVLEETDGKKALHISFVGCTEHLKAGGKAEMLENMIAQGAAQGCTEISCGIPEGTPSAEIFERFESYRDIDRAGKRVIVYRMSLEARV